MAVERSKSKGEKNALVQTPAGSMHREWKDMVEAAAMNGEVGELTELLKLADARFADEHGFSPLISAAIHGQARSIEALAAHSDMELASNQLQFTALHHAVKADHPHCVAALIASGCDVNARARKGATALHQAARWSHGEDCLEILLDRADPNARNSRGETPLMVAILHGNDAAALRLAEITDCAIVDALGRTPLMSATECHSPRALVKKLAVASDANHRGPDGWTALMWAACNNDLKSIEILIPHSNPSIRNKDGKTALEICKDSGDGMDPVCAGRLEAHLFAHAERIALNLAIGPSPTRSKARAL